MEKFPKVSVALIVKKENKILLGKRKKFPVAWGFPGGKLDFNEDINDCILRELDEKVGISVKNLKVATVTNDVFKCEGVHYVTIIMTCDYAFGEVTLKEPEKCECWDWFSWDSLPESLSLPIINLLKQGFNPFS